MGVIIGFSAGVVAGWLFNNWITAGRRKTNIFVIDHLPVTVSLDNVDEAKTAKVMKDVQEALQRTINHESITP